ncbi:hypothetical protein HQQ94_04050 [Shewanella sp. VB17]|uniref:hypothetical protein n=1 Tax=Shewanella sp. VB17 TaxID=2739432 RepID=UPI001566991F|nr:hypothetical protein [Shewanella sp. VB17]NRD72430.1 hypothetical protein [Shewanella sp. VB17]
MHLIVKFINVMILLLSLILAAEAADKQKITFAFMADPNASLPMKWAELVYTDAFSRLNIDFSYKIMPAIRASKMIDLGKIDGEPIRWSTYSDSHPSLIRIEYPLGSGSINAYTYDPSIKIDSWEDIQKQEYKVEYYRGIAIAKLRLSQYVAADRLTDSSSPAESLRKIIRGRIDIYIGSKALTTSLLATPEFTNSHILMIAKLEEILSYGYLHSSHSDLAVKLVDVFRQMKSEGKFKNYQIQATKFIQLQHSQSKVNPN